MEKTSNSFLDFFKKRKVQKSIIIVLFLTVPLVLIVLFTYVPLGDMVKYSFEKWNGTSKNHEFVGWDNYKTIFERPEYLRVLKNSIYYFVVSFYKIKS